MNSPKVSVILTSYNHEKFLREAIESALSQTHRDFELIIWDDASTDNSWSIIKQYNDSRIRAFRNDVNRYGVYGVNKAISEIAQGEYIAIHHSDDVWKADKLEKQVDFLDRHPEVGAVFSWADIIDENGNINNDFRFCKLGEMFRKGNQTRHEWLRYFFFAENTLCHPSVLIRRQCYVDCGLYSPLMWILPDFDMWVRLCFRHEIHILPECLVKYRWLSSNTCAFSESSAHQASFERYMVLHNYRRIANIEEFLQIFPSSAKYFPPTPDADIEFALAMTAIEANLSARHHLFGLQLLYKLLSSPERAGKIHAVHHFDHMDFMNITKRERIFAPLQSSSRLSPLEKGIEAFDTANLAVAIECLSTAMADEPENPLPYAYLAFVCARQGLLQGARDFIAQTIRLAPERADLVAALGEVFLKEDNPSEAADYLREAVAMQPDLFAAYPALAKSLRLTGQSEEAASILKSVAAAPSDSQVAIQTTLRQILIECGDLPTEET
ncbi:MAG: glycosyltransferase [Betaproteobacteria bacterium]|nr:glycosyltransferase [Betaproteobacteria bacterium]